MKRFPQYLGACRVLLAVDRETVRWGEMVTGRCTLLGGLSEQRVSHVQVSLVLDIAENLQLLPGSRSTVWTDLCIPAGEKVELPFTLPVPVRSVLGTPVQVQLTVRLPELWGLGTFAEDITFEPSADYIALAEIAGALTGLQVGSWQSLAGGDGLGVRLRRERSVEAALDGLEIRIFQWKGGFHGDLIVDPAADGMGGRIKTFAGLNRVRCPYRVPRDGHEETARQFEHLLRPYIHPNRHHPVPSQVSAASLANLPVVAEGERRGQRNLPHPSGRSGRPEEA